MEKFLEVFGKAMDLINAVIEIISQLAIIVSAVSFAVAAIFAVLFVLIIKKYKQSDKEKKLKTLGLVEVWAEAKDTENGREYILNNGITIKADTSVIKLDDYKTKIINNKTVQKITVNPVEFKEVILDKEKLKQINIKNEKIKYVITSIIFGLLETPFIIVLCICFDLIITISKI